MKRVVLGCNPNFSHVNLPPRLPTRGTLTLLGKRAEKPTLFSALEAISQAQRRRSSTLRLIEVKPDFLTEEADIDKVYRFRDAILAGADALGVEDKRELVLCSRP